MPRGGPVHSIDLDLVGREWHTGRSLRERPV